VGANGSFVFAAGIASGAAYDVRVVKQPADPMQQCVVQDGFGTMGAAGVTTPRVVCSTPVFRFAYSVGPLIVQTPDQTPTSESWINAYAVEPTTAFPRLRTTLRQNYGYPAALAAHPNGRVLYALIYGSAGAVTIAAYAVDFPSGRMTEVAGSPFATGLVWASATAVPPTSMEQLAINSAGTALFATSRGDRVAGFAIEPVSGALSMRAGSPYVAGAGASNLSLDSSGRYVYVFNGIARTASSYAVDGSTGGLNSLGAVPAAAALKLHPNGRFAYTTATTSQLAGYAIDESGALTLLPGASVATSLPIASLALRPGGKLLDVFVHEFRNVTLESYQIDPSGALTRASSGQIGEVFVDAAHHPSGKYLYYSDSRVQPITFPTANVRAIGLESSLGFLSVEGAERARLAISPTGRQVFAEVAGAVPGTMPFAVRPDGGLALTFTFTREFPHVLADAGRFLAPASPVTATVPTFGSKLAFVVNQGDDSISAYTIDATTGALTSNGAATPADSSPVALATRGRLLLVAAASPATLSAYTIDPLTGTLARVPGGTAIAATPTAVEMDLEGSYAWVTSQADSTVTAFRVNQQTGALQALGAAATAAAPLSLAFNRQQRTLLVSSATQTCEHVIDASMVPAACTSRSPQSHGYPIVYPPGSADAETANPAAVSPTGKFHYFHLLPASAEIAAQRRFEVSRVPAPPDAVSLAANYDGRFLYVLSRADARIAVYSIDPSTGALTAVGGGAATGAAPLRIAVTEDML
jgi:6-phosphogluconolactonase (cycloisomerase 2 family)